MRTFRILVLSALAAGSLTVLAPAAHASAPAATKLEKFCASVAKISANSSSSKDSAAALQLAKTTRKAAKLAPTAKVKSALNTMADYYEAIGNASNDPGKAAAALKSAAKYTKAAAVFSTYYAKNCSGVG
jgi:hypothetical protein